MNIVKIEIAEDILSKPIILDRCIITKHGIYTITPDFIAFGS
jgi:hypothetical protein